MAHYENIREESLKLKVAADWFQRFDCTDIIGRIDFAVKIQREANAIDFDDEYLLWAEAKQQPTDIYRMLAQLIVTIKADAFQRVPPRFVGCFDNEKIAFVEYHDILSIYQINDFNWTQTPSAIDEKTVQTVRQAINSDKVFVFDFEADAKELKSFIRANFSLRGGRLRQMLINKNNFIFVYQRWRSLVMPKIDADWELLKKEYAIYDRDFFLAELNIDDNGTVEIADDKVVNHDFYITFRATDAKPYEMVRKDDLGIDMSYRFGFKADGLRQYTDFWKRYKRPPQNEYWSYIVERLDLLVPQDIRERKGAFFTPQVWVEKSQQYLANELGENWQEEYYVWDCCAGTGNLLNGLANKYNVFASTLDQQDVDVMKERIKNGANLLESHVFQFDFLNDDFSKCPQSLQDIINDPEKRKKLVIYINPPYAEADNRKGEGRRGVAENRIHDKYAEKLKKAQREVFALFFIRIHDELNQCILAEFSKLKMLCASNFVEFRQVFNGAIKKSFIVPGNTFDNVKGAFPIGFFIWDLKEPQRFTEIITDAYDANGNFICKKIISSYDDSIFINKWIDQYRPNKKCIDSIGTMIGVASDFQNQKLTRIERPYMKVPASNHNWQINGTNLIESSIYLAARHCIEATWLNDRDQFLYPNDGWKTDAEFQTDCLVYTLFHGQNRISSEHSVNHWIPFTEDEVGAQEKFASHFMSDFLRGKIRVAGASATNTQTEGDLFAVNDDVVETCHGASPRQQEPLAIKFSPEATAVMDAGRELWRYYHAQPVARERPNASFYDIRLHFQGTKTMASGKQQMNPDSTDETYTRLIGHLRVCLKALAKRIEPKVYEYGFLKG